MKETTFAVLGMGNGGHAFAAHLSLLGFRVRAWDVDPGRAAVIARVGISVDGAVCGNARPELVTADLGEAMRGADVVLVTVPSNHHGSVARRIAEHIHEGQIVVLNPGATGGALEVRAVLTTAGKPRVTVAETSTLIYACRSSMPGEVSISRIKDSAQVGVLPGSEGANVTELLSEALPRFHEAPSVLHTSMSNISAMVHPLPTLLNASRCERGEAYKFYLEGMSRGVCELVEALDGERLAVAGALGVEVSTVLEWYEKTYAGSGSSLYERLQSNLAYANISGPTTLSTRYLREDVPMGLVPLSEMARAAAVPTPIMDSTINLASTLLETNFRAGGRTLERLGLVGIDAPGIRAVAC